VTQGVNCPAGRSLFSSHGESQGELGFYIHSKGGGTARYDRLNIRSPSFVNLSILAAAFARDTLVSDVVAILGSFDFVMGECDR